MRRILFVDDERSVLDELRGGLQAQADKWEMVFVESGSAALEEIKRSPVDVLVSDLCMPQMDGAALLKQVRKDYPKVVRILLAEFSETEETLGAVALAHQFLIKPCDPEDLRQTVQRTSALQDLLSDDNIRRAVGEASTLPALPKTYERLNKAMADLDVSITDLSHDIEQDVGMAAKVLQLINSSFFGLPQEVTSIQYAISYLGLRMLRSVVLSVGVFGSFEEGRYPKELRMEALQRHSVTAAALTKHVVPDKEMQEDCSTAALLHDVGYMILANRMPKEFAAIVKKACASKRPVHEVEAEELKVTHAEIGASLLALWGLPYTVVEAVAHHHHPSRVQRPEPVFDVVGVVHVADVLTREYESAAGKASLQPSAFDLEYLRAVGKEEALTGWRDQVESVCKKA